MLVLWRQGRGFSDIGRILDAKPGSIFTLLREHGGVTLPRPTRSPRHLNLAEIEEISISLAANISIRQIACALHRSSSTISREINRNGGIGKYRANVAEVAAWKRAKRPKPAKLAVNTPLRSLVIEKLQLKWSPEQISGWLKIEFPLLKSMQISPETIYKSLYISSRKLLDLALMSSLHRSHKIRQSKRHSRRGDRGTISIVNGISIHKRPSEIEERTISGHWEGDLISGSGNTHIATLVDRKTRFTMLLKLDGKDTISVTRALIAQFKNIPPHYEKA